MITTALRLRVLRAATGVTVAASTAITLGVGFATSAGAAASAITATPDQPSYHVGSTASISVDPTGAPHSLGFVVESGPDAAGPAASACGPVGADGTATCSFTNGGGVGTDTIRVFDDLDDSGTFNAGEPAAVVSIVFYGDPATIGLTTTGTSTSVENCKVYTVSARDSKDNASENADIALTLTSTGATDALPTFCTASGAPASPAVTAKTVTTGADGTKTFSATGLATGTIRVSAASATDPSVNDSASFTVTGGKHTADDVRSLTVTPTTAVGAAGGTSAFTVTATDGNGDPVGDVVLRYAITSGPDQTAANTYKNCDAPTVQATGMATCTVHNTTAGTDTITLFVNQDTHPVQTPGPDPDEPQVNASVRFQVEPSYTNIAISCPDQTVAAGGPKLHCTVPLSPNSVTFTARVVNGENAAGNPIVVPNAVVNFTVLPGGASAKATPMAGSAVTNASGLATFVVTVPGAIDGDEVSVDAIVGDGSTFDFASPYANNESADGSAMFEAATATYLTLYPSVQTATVNADVTVKATVTDQFGAPVVNDKVNFFIFLGRNSGQNANIKTGADGTATYTYTDTGSPTSTGYDEIFASEANNGALDLADVNYITSSSNVANVIVSLGNCSAGHPTTTATDYVTQYGENEVCAIVTNSLGVRLAGKMVSFSVDRGFLTPGLNDLDSDSGSSSRTLTSDSTGTAVLYSGSRQNGDQTITVTSGGQTGSAVIQYVNFGTSITLTPASTAITAGGTQRFTATVKDQFGNLVPGQEVDFSVSGPGTLSNPIVFTTGDGTATQDVSVPAGAVAGGTVTASLPGTAAGTCGSIPGAVCTDTSTYSVDDAPTPANLDLSGAGTITAGDLATATAKVTNDDGSNAAGVVVQFSVTGANPGTSSSTTGSNGQAGLSYPATNAGTDTITAYADVNGNGIKDAGEPSDTLAITVKAIPSININAPTSTVTHRSIAIYGRVLPADAGQTVFLQQLGSSGWQNIASQQLRNQTLPSGYTLVGYNFAVTKNGAGSYSFRVVWPAAADHVAGMSATRTVSVSLTGVSINERSTKYSVRKNEKFKVYGAVKPEVVHQGVALQRYNAATGKWDTVQTTTLTRQALPSGVTAVGYIFTAARPTAGPVKYRVYWGAHSDHKAGYSRVITVRVS